MSKQEEETANVQSTESIMHSFEELNLMDSFLFESVTEKVEDAEKIARIIVERATGHHAEHLVIESQKQLRGINIDKRGIRMDLYFTEPDTTKEGRIIRIYDIEPNNYYEEEIPRRNRFYHALIDTKLLPKGVGFEKLPDVLTIWILPYDPFGEDCMIYTVKNVVNGNEKLSYNDGETKIFLYTKGTKGGNSKLKELLSYMENTRKENAVDEELQQIQNIVDEVKYSDEERARYLNLYGIIDYEKRDSYASGHAEGEIRGTINTCKSFGADRIRTKEELRKNYNLTDDKAEEYLELYW